MSTLSTSGDIASLIVKLLGTTNRWRQKLPRFTAFIILYGQLVAVLVLSCLCSFITHSYLLHMQATSRLVYCLLIRLELMRKINCALLIVSMIAIGDIIGTNRCSRCFDTYDEAVSLIVKCKYSCSFAIVKLTIPTFLIVYQFLLDIH